MRHNLRMPKQHSPEGTTLRVSSDENASRPINEGVPDLERWRCPLVLRVKSIVIAAAGVTLALVFFPPWFGIPMALVLGAWSLGLAALGASVVVDRAQGTLVLRMGLAVRRVRLTDVTAVLVDQAKVSIARANGGEISVYAWRKSPLDALLRVPARASDIGHSISSAVALARAARGPEAATGGAQAAAPGRTPARTRSRLATALLGGTGALAIAGALLVRVHWHSPVLTTLGVLIALVLGVSGLFYLLIALWILLTGRSPRTTLR
jgi:uncharacterized membrane protein YdbT with pleckstrin-like domain